MRVPTIATAVTATAVLAACSGRQAPVPLVGTAGDVQALVGEWAGEYSSNETGRSGSISFTLAAQGDTAHGDVVMIPSGWNRPLQPYRDEARPMDRPLPEVLTISFVRVSGDEVSGELAPYRDPECGCALHTRFVGQLRGDVIEGTYLTRHGELPQDLRGRWSAKRVSRSGR
ncbi:MAG TPA: hypothetical protein VF978_07605 [Gemmatimonadales bacterium]